MAVEAWPPWEILSLSQKLEALEARLERREELEPDIVGYLSRLLVVRSSGYLEQVAYLACRGYVESKSGGLVRAFAHSHLAKTRNPTPENLRVLIARFDHALETELEQLLDAGDKHLRRELYYLVDRRNRIAHGENESINPATALRLKGVACEIADWFILRLNPQS